MLRPHDLTLRAHSPVTDKEGRPVVQAVPQARWENYQSLGTYPPQVNSIDTGTLARVHQSQTRGTS